MNLCSQRLGGAGPRQSWGTFGSRPGLAPLRRSAASKCRGPDVKGLSAARAQHSGGGELGGDPAPRAHVQQTLQLLDDLLGLTSEAAEAQGERTPETPSLGQPPPPSPPTLLEQFPQWAHLAPEELARRERLLIRRRQLAERAAAVGAERDRHARSAAYHQQRLFLLERQCAQLAAQQQALQDELDPEAAAAWREAQQAQQEQEQRDTILAWVGLLAVTLLVQGYVVLAVAYPIIAAHNHGIL